MDRIPRNQGNPPASPNNNGVQQYPNWMAQNQQVQQQQAQQLAQAQQQAQQQQPNQQAMPPGADRIQVLLHQLLHTLRFPTTPEQQQQVMEILQSNPQLMNAYLQHQHQQQQQIQYAHQYQLLGAHQGQFPGMYQGQVGVAHQGQFPGAHQEQYLGPHQGQMPGVYQQAHGTQVLLQHLLQTLRSPTTPEQQQQVMQILQSNPQLMEAFIQHRHQQ